MVAVSAIYEDAKIAAKGRTRGRFCFTVRVGQGARVFRFNSREEAEQAREEAKA